MSSTGYPDAEAGIPLPAPAAFDVVVLGGGSAAEELCSALLEGQHGGRRWRVAVVEQRLVGGACPFYACMPSKAMLRSAAVRSLVAGARSFGAVEADCPRDDPEGAYALAARRRDDVAEGRRDDGHAADLRSMGVEVVRGHGRVSGPGRVLVDSAGGERRELAFGRLVVATGSLPALPPVEGLADVAFWTSDEALSRPERPGEIAVLGGGPVGCELAEIYARFGSRVLLIESSERLLAREEPELGEALAAHLERLGVVVRAPASLEGVRRRGEGALLVLEGGEELVTERLVVATGRRPAIDGLGLETLGVAPDEHTGALRVDEHCAVEGRDDLFAAGDVNGIAPFTHAAKYQARVIASNLLGERRQADHRVLPRCVYTDPPLFAVGMTRGEAEAEGLSLAVATSDLGQTARADSEGMMLAGPEGGPPLLAAGAGGTLVLVADRRRRVIVGGGALGPRADEWMNEVALAIRAAVPLGLLVEAVHPFPTYAEALGAAYLDLARQCR